MFKDIFKQIRINKEIKQKQKRIVNICLNQDKDCPEYFYEMMRLKLENLLEISKKDPFITFDPKYVHIAISLCKLLEENKTTYYRPINVLNHKNYDECKSWDFNVNKVIDFEVTDDLVFKIDAKMRAKFYKIKAKNILFKIINKNILYWKVL